MIRLTQNNDRKHPKTIMAMSVMVTALLTVNLMAPAMATHYGGQRWSGTSVDMCYDSNSLNLITLDGSTNQFATISTILDSARNDWNNEPSAFTLNKIGFAFCSHWNYSAALGSSGPLGVTYRAPLTGTPLTDNDTEFNRNVTWTSSTTCTGTSPYRLLLTSTHEYGHWVRFVDVSSGSPSDTIMWYSYDCASNTVKSHDSTSLTSVYG